MSLSNLALWGKSASETRMLKPSHVDFNAMKLNKNKQMFHRIWSKGCCYMINSGAVLVHLIVFPSLTKQQAAGFAAPEV